MVGKVRNLAEAGFTHSLTPARHCTFGCTYCYVPTMRVRAGSSFRRLATLGAMDNHQAQRGRAAAARTSSRSDHLLLTAQRSVPARRSHGSPDARSPRSRRRQSAQGIRDPDPWSRDRSRHRFAARSRRTNRFACQFLGHSRFRQRPSNFRTRLRTDLGTLENRCGVAIGRNRNICCDRSDIALRSRGADRTGGSSRFRANRCGPIVADPFHVRAVKRAGATTRDAAIAICVRHGWNEWLDPMFQRSIIDRMAALANANGRKFGHGAAGFGLLACAGNIH